VILRSIDICQLRHMKFEHESAFSSDDMIIISFIGECSVLEHKAKKDPICSFFLNWMLFFITLVLNSFDDHDLDPERA
jgi:hypothetical protein